MSTGTIILMPRLNAIRYKLCVRGFSLIEIVLALFLVMALLSILFTSTGTYIHSRNSNLQSIAAKIASREIENLRNTDFGSLPGTSSFSDSDLTKLPSGTTNRTVSNYQSDVDIKQITVIIGWTEKGVAKQLVMDTLISRNGL